MHTAFLAGDMKQLATWAELVKRGAIDASTAVGEETSASVHRSYFTGLLDDPPAARDAYLRFLSRTLPLAAGMADPVAEPVDMPACDAACRGGVMSYLDAFAPPADGAAVMRDYAPDAHMLTLAGALRIEEAVPHLLAWVGAERIIHTLSTDYTTNPEPALDAFDPATVALVAIARGGDDPRRSSIRAALLSACEARAADEEMVWHVHTDDRSGRSEARRTAIGGFELGVLYTSKRPLLAAAIATIDSSREGHRRKRAGRSRERPRSSAPCRVRAACSAGRCAASTLPRGIESPVSGWVGTAPVGRPGESLLDARRRCS